MGLGELIVKEVTLHMFCQQEVTEFISFHSQRGPQMSGNEDLA